MNAGAESTLSEQEFENIIKKEDQGYLEGTSKFWRATYGVAFHNNVEPFWKYWDAIKGNLQVEHLLQESNSPFEKGKSIFWLLAFAASEGRSQPFIEVCKHFGEKIPIDYLLKKAGRGNDGPSTLELIAIDARDHSREAMDVLWEYLKDSIHIEHFLKDVEVLAFLTTFRNLPLLQKILHNVPGQIPQATLNARVCYMLRGNNAKVWYTFEDLLTKPCLTLIKQRNAFYAVFEVLKKATISNELISAFLCEAGKIQQLGYLSAFYEVGEYLYSQGHVEAAIKAYQNVPEESAYYSKSLYQIKKINSETTIDNDLNGPLHKVKIG